MEEILDLLRQNARLSAADIAALTKKTEEEVCAIIKKLEDDGVILKYAAIVNPEKDKENRDKVLAEIQKLQMATDTIKDSIQEMQAGAEHINQTGAELYNISGKMADNIKQIGSEIDLFKV